ncbi:hypothetical protein LCGC14_0938140 [marine sediment metagenome]|uniref:Uncharacterized protein n=1 Tax=marine sediment metagenome TaxID=412755 RepID=A0A0F9RS79_9ZZZZ|nr:hypothetical protein [bacterium]
MEDELKGMIKAVREKKKRAGFVSRQLNNMKEALRVFMIDEGIQEYDGVSIRRNFSSFDLELFRIEHPVEFAKYCKYEEQKVITFNSTCSKENLEKIRIKFPNLWNDSNYRKEKTAGLYGL